MSRFVFDNIYSSSDGFSDSDSIDNSSNRSNNSSDIYDASDISNGFEYATIDFKKKYDHFSNQFISEVFNINGKILTFYKPKTMEILKYKDIYSKKVYEKVKPRLKFADHNDFGFISNGDVFTSVGKDPNSVNNQLFSINFDRLKYDTPYFNFTFYDYCIVEKKKVIREKISFTNLYSSDNLTTSKLGLFHSKNLYTSFHQSTILSTNKNAIQVANDESDSFFTFLFEEITDLEELEKSIFFLSRYKDTKWLGKNSSKANYLSYLFFKNNESLIKETKLRSKSLCFYDLNQLLEKRPAVLKICPADHINIEKHGEVLDVKKLFDNHDYFNIEYIQKTVISPDKYHLAVLTSFGRIKIFLTNDLKGGNDGNRVSLQFSHLDDNVFFQKNQIKVSLYKKRFRNEVEVHMADMDWNILNNGSIKDIEWLDDKQLLYVTDIYTQRADKDFSAIVVPSDNKVNFGFESNPLNEKTQNVSKRDAIFKEPVLKVLYLPKNEKYYNKRSLSDEITEGHLYPYSLTLNTFELFQYPQLIAGVQVNLNEKQLLILVLCENENGNKMNYALLNFEYTDSTLTNKPVSVIPISVVPLRLKPQITGFEIISKNQCLIRYGETFEWINLETCEVIRKVVISNRDLNTVEKIKSPIILPLEEDEKNQSDMKDVKIYTDFDMSERNDSGSASRGLSVTPEPKQDSSRDRVNLLLNAPLNTTDPPDYYNILNFNENKFIIYDILSKVYLITFDDGKAVSQTKLKINISGFEMHRKNKINLIKYDKENQELLMIFNERNVATCKFNSLSFFENVLEFTLLIKE